MKTAWKVLISEDGSLMALLLITLGLACYFWISEWRNRRKSLNPPTGAERRGP